LCCYVRCPSLSQNTYMLCLASWVAQVSISSLKCISAQHVAVQGQLASRQQSSHVQPELEIARQRTSDPVCTPPNGMYGATLHALEMSSYVPECVYLYFAINTTRQIEVRGGPVQGPSRDACRWLQPAGELHQSRPGNNHSLSNMGCILVSATLIIPGKER